MKIWIFMLAGVAPSLADAATVSVGGSTLAPDLSRALAVELGPEAVVTGPADFEVGLRQKGEVLELTVYAADGTQVIERDLDGPPGPAVRVATLLVASLVRAHAPAPAATPDEPPSPPSPPPPRPFTGTSTVPLRAPQWITGLRLSASGVFLGFARPSTPRPGLGLGGHMAIRAGPIIGFIGVGLSLSSGARTTSEIAASLFELHVQGELGVQAASFGALRLFGVVGGGTSRYTGEARALVFAATGTTTSIEPLEQASLWLLFEARYRLGPALDAWARGGIRVGSKASPIELPPAFTTTDPVEAGTFVPWAALGLGWTLGS